MTLFKETGDWGSSVDRTSGYMHVRGGTGHFADGSREERQCFSGGGYSSLNNRTPLTELKQLALSPNHPNNMLSGLGSSMVSLNDRADPSSPGCSYEERGSSVMGPGSEGRGKKYRTVDVEKREAEEADKRSIFSD